MFIIFFSLFILLLTIFENPTIGTLVIILSLITISVYGLIKHKNMDKTIWLCILSFILAIWSVYLYNYRYDQVFDHYQTTNIFIWSGQILNMSSPGKYIFSDGEKEYSLQSSKKYEISDAIRLVWNVKTTKNEKLKMNNGWKEFFVFHFSLFTGLFHHEFNYDKRLKMKWLHGSIFENNSVLLEQKNSLWFIVSMRKWLQSLVKKSYGENKIWGLVLGMLIGDRSEIPPDDYQTFVDSGLVHLIAVSGGNIIMIVVFLWFVLIRVPFYIRTFIILIIIVTYGFLCGMDSSVFRAVIMGGIWMIALFRWREISVWRLMSFAFVLMLLLNPYFLVYDVGFIFSFSAIIGLVYFNQARTSNKEKEKKDKKIILQKTKIWLTYVRKNYLSPSIWATIGIFPSMIFFMGKINLIGTLGNLFVLPIVPIVMIYGFISTLLYNLFPRIGFIKIEEWLISYVYWVSKITAQFGVYMNVEGDRIKWMILCTAVIWLINKRMKNEKWKMKNEKTF